MSRSVSLPEPWSEVREQLHQRGMRWTPQRRTVIEVLAASSGHVTSAELIERCRERDPQTIPSTVYRTMDALEELGLVRHGHGADGREEFHVGPDAEGATCTVRAKLNEIVDDRKLYFDVAVTEGERTIGVGTHQRRVIAVPEG